MDQLPRLPEYRPSPLVHTGIVVLVPILLLLAIPLLLLLIVVLHFAALFHGGRILVFSIKGVKEIPERDMPKPHFLEWQAAPRLSVEASESEPEA